MQKEEGKLYLDSNDKERLYLEYSQEETFHKMIKSNKTIENKNVETRLEEWIQDKSVDDQRHETRPGSMSSKKDKKSR